MQDWTKVDISCIPEADFPIWCYQCDRDLTGLGDSGQCPECGLPFARRQRLWQMYGPEAFANPPITRQEQEASRQDAAFISALLIGIGVTLSLPLMIMLWMALFGTIDLCFCLFVWIVSASVAVWLTVARHKRRTPEDQPPTADAE